jgi:hypothetical protein
VEDIARRFDKSADAILALNEEFDGLTKRSKLPKGAVLVLPQNQRKDSKDGNGNAGGGLPARGSQSASDEDSEEFDPSPKATAKPQRPVVTYEVTCPHCLTKMPVPSTANLIHCSNSRCARALKVKFSTGDDDAGGGGDDEDDEDGDDGGGDDDDNDDVFRGVGSRKDVGRRSRSTRKRKPVKHFTLSMGTEFKRTRKKKDKTAPVAGAPGAIGVGGMLEQASASGSPADPYVSPCGSSVVVTACACRHRCSQQPPSLPTPPLPSRHKVLGAGAQVHVPEGRAAGGAAPDAQAPCG